MRNDTHNVPTSYFRQFRENHTSVFTFFQGHRESYLPPRIRFVILANPTMDTVPRIFIESVCLRLLDRKSLEKSTKLPSAWGQICTETCKKIHTLRMLLDSEKEKIYAAAQPALSEYRSVSLGSVDLKFITNFRIETRSRSATSDLVNHWKEITLNDLQRLVHFIRPVRNERHPFQYDYNSFNILSVTHESDWISGKLLSMRLPVDMVTLSYVNGFFESEGFLYFFRYHGPTLQQSAVDALIEKFVPIDYGRFNLHHSISDEQVTKLFEKCVISNKKVTVSAAVSGKSLDFMDLAAKHYSKKKIGEEGKVLAFFNGAEATLGLVVHLHEEWIQFQWVNANWMRTC
uniref:F-box domain-containing protein n=1 Tax=Steinernema glaseri TaxID=37863 RepID=A0A1I7Y495_9BILA